MPLTYGWPTETPLPGHGFDLCAGPQALDNDDDWGARWAVWVATAGIRYGLWAGEIMDDTFGDPNPLFTAGERPSHVSMAFDRAGLPIIAIQADATTIAVRKLVADVPTEFTFTGKSPLMFSNGPPMFEPEMSDRCCLYIKAAGDQLFARLESEDFATEHTMNAALNGNLRELLKTDVLGIHNWGDGSTSFYQGLWAINTVGKMVFMRSQFYSSVGGSS